MLVARRVTGAGAPTAGRLVAAFVAAFATFEALAFVFALVAGGTGTFTPAIILRILANDAVWFAALTALYLVLARTAPRLFPPTPMTARA